MQASKGLPKRAEGGQQLPGSTFTFECGFLYCSREKNAPLALARPRLASVCAIMMALFPISSSCGTL